MLLAHFLFHFPSFPAQDAIRRCFCLFLSSILPHPAAFVKWKDRILIHPKKRMNHKSPPLQESFRMSFTQTVLQHHRDCKVENTAAMPTLTGAADAADIFMRG
jgi:hypothetical protein